MSIIADYHTHSYYSGDCKVNTEIMIESAVSKGLHKYCLTEHMDYDYPDEFYLSDCSFLLDTNAYLKEAETLKYKYRDQIDLKIGVELGMQPHIIDFLNNYVKENPFDFVIGSLHLCNRIDPYFPQFYEGKSEHDAYLSYFEEMLTCIRLFHDYDVVGHIDYVVRYGPNKNKFYSYAAYSDVLDDILKTVIESGKGIEVNSAGIRKGLMCPNPCLDVIKRYKELGGEILTIGSDAHFAEHIAADFDKIEEILSSIGFKYYTVFSERKPEFLPLK